MAVDARSIYISGLRNTHAMEQQGLQQMEIQISRLERYRTMRHFSNSISKQHGSRWGSAQDLFLIIR
jgi:ferritin-like metal-binding protein YciE